FVISMMYRSNILFIFYLYLNIIFFFFFFQAEDGIRDKLVTGVQTCALPISAEHALQEIAGVHLAVDGADRAVETASERADRRRRSEERRVGKECRSRWSPEH